MIYVSNFGKGLSHHAHSLPYSVPKYVYEEQVVSQDSKVMASLALKPGVKARVKLPACCVNMCFK
jgi:hypothetical protein